MRLKRSATVRPPSVPDRKTPKRKANNQANTRKGNSRKRFRAFLVLLVAVSLCGFLDRGDIKGFGFDYFERFPRQVQLSFAARRHPDLVEWARKQIVLVPISEATYNPATKISGPARTT